MVEESRMNGLLQKAVFGDLVSLDGFHETESDIWGPFVWSRKRFSLRRPQGADWYAAKMCYLGESGKLTVREPGSRGEERPLHKGWNTYPLDFSRINGTHIEFEISEIPPVEGDQRELGLMLRRFTPLANRSIADTLESVLENKTVNDGEYERGVLELESVPSKLRINTAVRCTMNPHCAYCDWERTKEHERDSGFTFSPDALRELGRFYTLSDEIVDNSYGEPFALTKFGDFLEKFHQGHKYYEVGSNGQLLDRRNRDKVLGKDVVIYVSADGADAEAYARYRDNTFDLLIENLRTLCQERQEHRYLPKIIMSFVAMRSNQDQVRPFFDLMRDVGVDGTKLIYLDPDPHLQRRVLDRNGFRFDYNAELLSFSELTHLYDESRREASEAGSHAISRLDFGAEETAGGGPICSEPWKNIHVLDRGIVVCLFSRTTPLVKWSERGDRTIEQFLLDVWNGSRYKEIRCQLSRGEFPELCRNSLSCPLVRRKFEKAR